MELQSSQGAVNLLGWLYEMKWSKVVLTCKLSKKKLTTKQGLK